MTASKNTKKKGSSSNGASNFNNPKAPKKDEKRKSLSAADEAALEASKLATPLKDGSSKKTPVVDPDIDEHPLKNSNYLVVKYRDGSHRLAKIIEKMIKTVEKKVSYSYYVHYTDFNRRMDEWVISERIVLFPSAANVLGAEYTAAHSHAHTAEEKKATGDEPTCSAVKKVSTSGNIKLSGASTGSRRRSSRSAGDADNIDKADGKGEGKDGGKEDEGEYDSEMEVEGEEEEGHDTLLCDNNESMVTTVAELEHDEHEGLDEASLLEHEEITKVKNVANVLFGRYIMECWYFSPFPKEFTPNGPVEFLYFCEFSFRFFRTKDELIRYQNKPNLPRHPPGNEIYRDSNVSMFEMDGAVEKVYCQNLCFFAKLFLDHKTLYWDVDPFLFYVLCSQDDRGYHPVGFFSKEKYSDLGYNLACILTFPSAQRKGYGRFLISFSYELSKKEEKVGSPEKPLSDLGALSYRSYWASTLLVALKNYTGPSLSVSDLCKMTSILTEDTAATLLMMGCLQTINGKETILTTPELIEESIIRFPMNGLQVDIQQLHWSPLYVTDPKKDKWAIKGKKDIIESSPAN